MANEAEVKAALIEAAKEITITAMNRMTPQEKVDYEKKDSKEKAMIHADLFITVCKKLAEGIKALDK